MSPQLDDLLALASREHDALACAQRVLPRVLALVGAEKGSIFLMSGQQVVQRLLANKESFPEVSAYKVASVLSQGLAGWVLAHRQGALATDIARDSRWVTLGEAEAGSALVVPMISRGLVVGLIALHHAQPGFFRERHLAAAAEAALALAPVFDVTLVVQPMLASIVGLCRGYVQPALVLDWTGQVLAVNAPLAALDVAWEGVPWDKTVLAAELGVTAVPDLRWEGHRALRGLPMEASVSPFQGVGALVELRRRDSTAA